MIGNLKSKIVLLLKQKHTIEIPDVLVELPTVSNIAVDQGAGVVAHWHN